MEIKDKLKQRRIELSLTMADVANAVGVSEATVSRWESGNISDMKRNRIVALAKVLQISPTVIMGWDDENSQQINKATAFGYITPHEKKLIDAYRSKPQMQSAVDTLLGITEETSEERPTRTMKIAAYGGGVMEHEITATDEEIMQAIEESEDDQFIIKKQD